MIVAEALHKRFANPAGKHAASVVAVEEVSLVAEDAAITGLLGPNGAGKSTTLRMLATLITPDGGSASIDGFDVVAKPLEARRQLGFMPHDAGIYPRLTARENIDYFARLCSLSRADARQRTDELIEQLDMGDFAERRARGFSQGQKTKVALARALVHRPQTIMLDEPTNGLDVMATRALREIIRQLASDGHAVLFSSHVMQEVAALCDRIAIIAHGKLATIDTLPAILEATSTDNLEDAFVLVTRELEPDFASNGASA
ncbi:MAG: ABC transporter ATP-binding protein [Gammaproteobacteria bacterium]|nr:MAG: ABC transporter ATP-binding protein [Gammaproteobacteria bacterium]